MGVSSFMAHFKASKEDIKDYLTQNDNAAHSNLVETQRDNDKINSIPVLNTTQRQKHRPSRGRSPSPLNVKLNQNKMNSLFDTKIKPPQNNNKASDNNGHNKGPQIQNNCSPLRKIPKFSTNNSQIRSIQGTPPRKIIVNNSPLREVSPCRSDASGGCRNDRSVSVHKFKNPNSPTRNSFLRKMYNGGKGGLSEIVADYDYQVEDGCKKIYYALPNQYYGENFKPSHKYYKDSDFRHYSPDPYKY